MTVQTETFEAPACWACYYINSDASGPDDAEIAAADKLIDEYLQGRKYFHVCGCGEPYFGTLYHFDWGQDGVTGGDICEYTALFENE